MTALVGTVVTALLLAAAACAAGIGLLVVPFVRSVDVAERHGFSAARWGAVSLAAGGLAALVGAWVLQHDHPVLLVVPAALAWAGPAALALLDASQTRVGGVQGGHER